MFYLITAGISFRIGTRRVCALTVGHTDVYTQMRRFDRRTSTSWTGEVWRALDNRRDRRGDDSRSFRAGHDVGDVGPPTRTHHGRDPVPSALSGFLISECAVRARPSRRTLKPDRRHERMSNSPHSSYGGSLVSLAAWAPGCWLRGPGRTSLCPRVISLTHSRSCRPTRTFRSPLPARQSTCSPEEASGRESPAQTHDAEDPPARRSRAGGKLHKHGTDRMSEIRSAQGAAKRRR